MPFRLRQRSINLSPTMLVFKIILQVLGCVRAIVSHETRNVSVNSGGAQVPGAPFLQLLFCLAPPLDELRRPQATPYSLLARDILRLAGEYLKVCSLCTAGVLDQWNAGFFCLLCAGSCHKLSSPGQTTPTLPLCCSRATAAIYKHKCPGPRRRQRKIGNNTLPSIPSVSPAPWGWQPGWLLFSCAGGACTAARQQL